MEEHAFDQKVQRFLKFVIAARERYNVPALLFEKTGFQPEQMLENRDARVKMVTQVLPMIAQSSPDAMHSIMYLRAFFEKMSVEDRDKMIEEDLLPALETHAEKVQTVIKFVKENREQLNSDMRTLGAYLTMFTEGYLKPVVATK